MDNKSKKEELILNNDSLEELKELKSKGYIITDSIYGNGENNYRLYGAPPFQDAEKDGLTISLGPFPVEKQHYEILANNLKVKEVDEEIRLAIFLTPIKIQYEIYGICDSSYEPKINQDLLEEMVIFLKAFYNLTNPVKTENIYWIMPKEDAAKKFYLINNIPKEKQTEKWWNIRVQMSSSSTEKEYNIKAGEHFLVPYVINEWSEYLPYRISVPLFELFSIGNKNGRFIGIKENEFKAKLLNFTNRDKNKNTICREPDKEILCKKLYEENNIKYPTTNEEIFDFFIELSFIKRIFKKGENYIYINKNIKGPAKILKITDNWKQLNDQYNSSGSIVLNYVSLDEYIKATTKNN